MVFDSNMIGLVPIYIRLLSSKWNKSRSLKWLRPRMFFDSSKGVDKYNTPFYILVRNKPKPHCQWAIDAVKTVEPSKLLKYDRNKTD